MGLLALINHAVNFLAPALWLALGLPFAVVFFMKKRPLALSYIGCVALLFGVGSAVLIGGLVVFGRDGKMLTYLALVLALATTQTWLSRR